MCANSEGSGKTARMRRLAWAFAGRICDKYRNLMSWLAYCNDPKFSDRQVWAKCVDPDQTAPLYCWNLVEILMWLQQIFWVSEFLGVLQYTKYDYCHLQPYCTPHSEIAIVPGKLMGKGYTHWQTAKAEASLCRSAVLQESHNINFRQRAMSPALLNGCSHVTNRRTSFLFLLGGGSIMLVNWFYFMTFQ